MGTSLNCKKTKLHEVTKLHENKIARVPKTARITFLHGSKKKQKKLKTEKKTKR